MTTLLIRAGHVVGGEAGSGWVFARDGVITQVGDGEPPPSDDRLDLPGCVAVPGLVNSHDHLYQWATRGKAFDEGLFGWLQVLYPIWSEIDAEVVAAAARAAIGRLLLSGCTLSTDHHYVFPVGRAGIFEALIDAARELGIRFHPCRGSMSLGSSQGGLPPDEMVEDEDDILADSEAMVARYHEPAPGAMCRVALAPCSPFSVTPRLMTETAELGRRLGVRLHTHLAESVQEESFCVDRFRRRPLELMEDLGWIGADVWFAHGVHFADDEVERLGATRTGIAHCPTSNMRLGAGACRVRDLLDAGAPVGLGVDGSASNEDYHLAREVEQALLLARLRAAMLGDLAAASVLGPREAWAMATTGGATVLGRDDVGSLEPGKRADVALFRVDDLSHAGVDDPLVALALAPPASAEAVVIEGRVVVREGRLLTADEDELASGVRAATERLLAHA